MATKLVDLKTYNRKKKLDGLTRIEYIGLLINIPMAMFVGTCLIVVFLKATQFQWAARMIVIGTALFGCYHLRKIAYMLRNGAIRKNLEYLSTFIMTVIVCFAFSSLLCLELRVSEFLKAACSFAALILCGLDIRLLIKLNKHRNESGYPTKQSTSQKKTGNS